MTRYPPGTSGSPKLHPNWRERLAALRRWRRSQYDPQHELCLDGLALTPDLGSTLRVNAQGGVNLDGQALGGDAWFGSLRSQG